MINKLKTIRHSVGFQQSAITVVGSLTAAGLSAVATLLITRKLGPEQFGVFSVGFALVQILIRLCDFGMTTVIQRFAGREKDQKVINRLFSFTTKVRLITWLLLIVIGISFGSYVARILNFSYPLIITAAFILAGATYFYEHFQAMLQSIHRFTHAAVANILQALIKFLLSIFLYSLTSVSTFTVFFGYMLSPVLPYIFFHKFFPGWVSLKLKSNFTAESKAVSKFALHSAVSFISAGIIENIDVLFVQSYLSTFDAGLLSGANKIALLFSIIAYALGNVLNSRVSRYTSKTDIKQYLKKAGLIFMAAGVGFLAFLPLARVTLLYTIGSEYLPALPILIILVASSFLTIAAVPFIALFFSFNKPYYFSVSGIIQLIVIISGNIFFVPEYGLDAAAWTRLIARVALLMFTLYMAWISYKEMYEKAQ